MRIRCIESWRTDDPLVYLQHADPDDVRMGVGSMLIPWEVEVTEPVVGKPDQFSGLVDGSVTVVRVMKSPDGLLQVASAGIPCLRVLEFTRERDNLTLRWHPRNDKKSNMFLVGGRLVAVEEVPCE